MEIYRLKEAFIIFWAVLTHKNYLFASTQNNTRPKGRCYFYISENAKQCAAFLDAVIDTTSIIRNYKNNKINN